MTTHVCFCEVFCMIALSEEERKWVKSAIILPMVLTVFERDKHIIAEKIKTPKPYLDNIEKAMSRVHQDLVNAKRLMREKGIKIYDKERTDRSIKHKYVCRGYHHEDTFLWDYLQVEVETLMGFYLSGYTPENYGV